MGEFKSASTWMKLSMLMISLGFSMHLFAMDAPGFGQDACFAGGYGGSGNGNGNGNNYGGNNYGYGGNCDSSKAVQALEVIGFLAILTALFLVLCLVLLDELQGNKIALICKVVFAFVAGLFIIIGIAVYESRIAHSEFSSCVAVMAGLAAILGGIFGVLELVGVSPPAVK